jgi:hypothetical protein
MPRTSPKASSKSSRLRDPPEAQTVLEAVRQAARINRSSRAFEGYPWKPIVRSVEKLAKQGPLPQPLLDALRAWHTAASPRDLTPEEQIKLGLAEAVIADENVPWSKASTAFQAWERFKRITTPLKDERKLLERLEALLGEPGRKGDNEDDPILPSTDAVGAALAADRGKGGAACGPAWSALLRHAMELPSTKPSPKWIQRARELVAAVAPAAYADRLRDWFSRAGQPAPVARLGFMRHPMEPTLLNDESADLLKGLAWSVAAGGRDDLAPALGALAEACYRKVPHHGPRNVRVANAAAGALAALANPEAGAELARLRTRVKHRSSRAMVDKAVGSLSAKTGLSPEDLAEMSVPAYGLDAAVTGVRREKLGECAVELRVNGAHSVELNWFGPGGKPTKSVPAAVKARHADALKQLKRQANEASRMLAGTAVRLERLYLTERTWPLAQWRERYLDHPLVGTLARRLIWAIGDATAIWHDGRFVDAEDRRLTPRAPDPVRLWHPMSSSPEGVLAWRRWLESHEVVQPFKQAHREVYVLTDAERKTRTYSNRFAAHILRQHQFAALAQHRGWDCRLQGDFDSDCSPTLALPQYRMTAEFWVEPVGGEPTQRGIHFHVASDQVRFGRPLADVPPVVFSEVMRDVDLFVAVASVGNDPTWQDGDSRGAYRDYWEHYSFGPLSETAATRWRVLKDLLPRLRIADRCSLIERFLVVRGDLRTYKIHLGSGNVLMEPNDQYLCVVPDRTSARSGATDRVFLPFEGDSTLSIIVSKALLLAGDARITDAGILGQIRARPTSAAGG